MVPQYGTQDASNGVPVQQAQPVSWPWYGYADTCSPDALQAAGEYSVPAGFSPVTYGWAQMPYWAPYVPQCGWPEVAQHMAVPECSDAPVQGDARLVSEPEAMETRQGDQEAVALIHAATPEVAPKPATREARKRHGGGSPPSWSGAKGLGEPKDIGDNKEKSEHLIANLEQSPDPPRQERAAKVMAWLLEPQTTQVLSFAKFGCRIVQRALDVGTVDQREQIAESLQDFTMDLLGDLHGNHVLAKLIEVMPPSRVTHVSQCLIGQVVSVARNRFGCRILERLLEHSGEGQVGFLLNEVETELEALARHQYGNFVVQHLLEHGTAARKFHAIQTLMPYVHDHAKRRTASHVVQRMLEHADSESKDTMVRSLLAGTEDQSLEAIMTTRYGSFVVQQLVNMASKTESPDWADELTARVKTNYPNLKKSQFGEKNLIEQLGQSWFLQ